MAVTGRDRRNDYAQEKIKSVLSGLVLAAVLVGWLAMLLAGALAERFRGRRQPRHA